MKSPIASRISRPAYPFIRARLLECGFTLRSFALQHGYHPQTVYAAAKGRRNGVESVKIVKTINRVIGAKSLATTGH